MKKITSYLILFSFFFASVASFSQNVVLMDCENDTFNELSFNVFANGAGESNADMAIVNNPLIAGANTSNKVASFLRRTGATALPFAGAFSGVASNNLDFTTNKFIHVKILKTKLSPTKFKIEGGPAGDIELASTVPYATVGVWQDMVFDFSAATGIYPTVVILPDFEDPLSDTGNITIYFDDIFLSNSAVPVGSLSTDAVKNDVSVKVYPTQIKNHLNVECTEKLAKVAIYNLYGILVFERKDFEVGNTIIDTSNFSNGMYIVDILSITGNRTAKKIIK